MASFTKRQAQEEKAKRAARRRLAVFVRLMWSTINPGHPLTWNWHLDVLCDRLERISRGENHKLIINVPPGSSKSTIVSIMWPCWEWLQRPELRIIGASYELALSTIFNVKRRQILQSARYQALRPSFRIVKGQKEKKLFKNTQMGTMRSVSTKSAVTGDHCDRLVIDDPLSPEGIYGPELQDHVRWMDETAASRFTDLTKAVWVLVMQRLHEEDLSGVLLADDPEGLIEHISIPAEYDPETASDWDPRTEKGESFFKARFPKSVLEDKKKRGTLQYSAQYNQRPTSAEGNMIKRDWWKRWDKLPQLRGAVWTGVWDTAYEAGEGHDYTTGEVWVAVGSKAYLVDQVHRKMSFVEMERAAIKLAEKWPLVPWWLVEQRALGQALIDRLQNAGVRTRPYKSQSTKAQRVQAVLPLIEMGQVFVPAEDCDRPEMIAARHQWTMPQQVEGFLEEMAAFPRGKHDDQVDAMAMALGELSPMLLSGPQQHGRRHGENEARGARKPLVKPRSSGLRR